MNATPAVSQAPTTNDTAAASGAGSVDSQRSSTGGRDFAAALSDAGPKPTRKPVTNKAHEGRPAGGQLPATGQVSPPAAAPAVGAGTPGAAALAAAIAGGAGGANPMIGAASGGTVATAQGAALIAGAQGKGADLNSGGAAADVPVAAPATMGAATAATAATAASAAVSGAGFAQALGLPGADSQESASGAPGTSEADPSGPGVPGASATGLAALLGPGAEGSGAGRGVGAALGASASARASAADGSVAKPITAAAATAAAAAATSGPAASDGSTAANAHAATQIPTAAALAAAVSGAVAASDAGFAGAADSPSSSTDDLATPATGSVVQDAGVSNGAAVPALAGAVIAHVAAAAVATATVRTQAVAALANDGTADKHSQGGAGISLLTDASGNSIAGTAQMSASATAAGDVSPTPTVKVGAGVETPEFGQGLADRVSWMVDNNLNGAKLQVNPPQLGPIEVRIAVQGDHAQVWLTSHSAVTRDALEASTPKLREMLGAQGFGQVSVDISQRSFQERSPQAQSYDLTPANRGAPTAPLSSAAISMPRISSGAVDAYA